MVVETNSKIPMSYSAELLKQKWYPLISWCSRSEELCQMQGQYCYSRQYLIQKQQTHILSADIMRAVVITIVF